MRWPWFFPLNSFQVVSDEPTAPSLSAGIRLLHLLMQCTFLQLKSHVPRSDTCSSFVPPIARPVRYGYPAIIALLVHAPHSVLFGECYSHFHVFAQIASFRRLVAPILRRRELTLFLCWRVLLQLLLVVPVELRDSQLGLKDPIRIFETLRVPFVFGDANLSTAVSPSAIRHLDRRQLDHRSHRRAVVSNLHSPRFPFRFPCLPKSEHPTSPDHR